MPDTDAPQLHPAIASVFPDADLWLRDPEGLRARIFAALRPFALMNRVSDDNPEELALSRGTASDATYIKSGDFTSAFDLLLDLGDPEFLERIADDDRWDPNAGR